MLYIENAVNRGPEKEEIRKGSMGFCPENVSSTIYNFYRLSRAKCRKNVYFRKPAAETSVSPKKVQCA